MSLELVGGLQGLGALSNPAVNEWTIPTIAADRVPRVCVEMYALVGLPAEVAHLKASLDDRLRVGAPPAGWKVVQPSAVATQNGTLAWTEVFAVDPPLKIGERAWELRITAQNAPPRLVNWWLRTDTAVGLIPHNREDLRAQAGLRAITTYRAYLEPVSQTLHSGAADVLKKLVTTPLPALTREERASRDRRDCATAVPTPKAVPRPVFPQPLGWSHGAPSSWCVASARGAAVDAQTGAFSLACVSDSLRGSVLHCCSGISLADERQVGLSADCTVVDPRLPGEAGACWYSVMDITVAHNRSSAVKVLSARKFTVSAGSARTITQPAPTTPTTATSTQAGFQGSSLLLIAGGALIISSLMRGAR